MGKRGGLRRFAQCFAESKDQRKKRDQKCDPLIAGVDMGAMT